MIGTSGLPVTIRLLDPPLHEFLPEGDLDHIVAELTAETGMTEDEVLSRVEKLSEVNPMLGFRGCRFDAYLKITLLDQEQHALTYLFETIVRLMD